jgi:hypothetical protein
MPLAPSPRALLTVSLLLNVIAGLYLLVAPTYWEPQAPAEPVEKVIQCRLTEEKM